VNTTPKLWLDSVTTHVSSLSVSFSSISYAFTSLQSSVNTRFSSVVVSLNSLRSDIKTDSLITTTSYSLLDYNNFFDSYSYYSYFY
jgi:hypothetical protein